MSAKEMFLKKHRKDPSSGKLGAFSIKYKSDAIDDNSLAGSIHAPPPVYATYDSEGNLVESAAQSQSGQGQGGFVRGSSVWSFDAVSVHTRQDSDDLESSLSLSEIELGHELPTQYQQNGRPRPPLPSNSVTSFIARKREMKEGSSRRTLPVPVYRADPNRENGPSVEENPGASIEENPGAFEDIWDRARRTEEFMVVATPVEVEKKKTTLCSKSVLLCALAFTTGMFVFLLTFLLLNGRGDSRSVQPDSIGEQAGGSQPTDNGNDTNQGPIVITVEDPVVLYMNPFFLMEFVLSPVADSFDPDILVHVTEVHITNVFVSKVPEFESIDLGVAFNGQRRTLEGSRKLVTPIFAVFDGAIRLQSGSEATPGIAGATLKEAFSGDGLSDFVTNLEMEGISLESLVVSDLAGNAIGATQGSVEPEVMAEIPLTAAPTVAQNPTKRPTLQPSSASPTYRPTFRPSSGPTYQPTMRPSSVGPTYQPTMRPSSVAPTFTPSQKPTLPPTNFAPSVSPVPPTPEFHPSDPPTDELGSGNSLWKILSTVPIRNIASNKFATGAAFDLTAKDRDVTIAGFILEVASLDKWIPVRVSIKNDPAAKDWKDVKDIIINKGRGVGKRTRIQLKENLVVNAGQTISVYIGFPEKHSLVFTNRDQIREDENLVASNFFATKRVSWFNAAITYFQYTFNGGILYTV